MSNDEKLLDIPEMPDVGDVLQDRYRLESVLATGGMGVIVRARQLAMDRDVAVKLLHPQYAANDKVVARFEREVDIAKHLPHPHIIQLFDFGRSESGHLYIVMEYLEGRDLKEIMNQDAPLSLGRATEIMLQALDGLAEAHEDGVIHRDLKPSNIYVHRNRRGNDFVKLLDFGISKSLELSSNLTATGEICGTVQYMAPEVILQRTAGKTSDVYAMGIIYLEMLYGQRIFDAESMGQTMLMQLRQAPPIPNRLGHTPVSDVIEKATAKHPEERYEDALEAFRALEGVSDRIPRGLTLEPEEFDARPAPEPEEMLNELERVERALESAESEERPADLMRELGEGGSSSKNRAGPEAPTASLTKPPSVGSKPGGPADGRRGGSANEESAATDEEGPRWGADTSPGAETVQDVDGIGPDGEDPPETALIDDVREQADRIGPDDDTLILNSRPSDGPEQEDGEPENQQQTMFTTLSSIDTSSLYPSGWTSALRGIDRTLLLLGAGVALILLVGLTVEFCSDVPAPKSESPERGATPTP